MKRIGILLMIISMAGGSAFSQINEKDSVIEITAAESGGFGFMARIFPDFVQLQWQNGPDHSVAHYELHRSGDGIAYTIVKQFLPETFEGGIERNLIYRDEDPLQGKNYYRLVAVMKSSLDKRILDLSLEYKNKPRKLQPTVTGRGTQLYIQNYDGEPLHLIVYGAGGNALFQRMINSSVVDFGSQRLAAGIYIYQLLDERKWVVNSGKVVLN